jgi:hypothetical protein
MPIASSPPLQAWGILPIEGIQDMAMRDAQSFRFYRRGQELSANDTIWASAMVQTVVLCVVRSIQMLGGISCWSRLIDIGVYDRGDRLDLNDDPVEKRSFQVCGGVDEHAVGSGP